MNGAHVGKKCLTSCGIRHMHIKRAPLYFNCNYLVQTKCIMGKNGGGLSRGKRAGALALLPPLWRPSVTPLRQARMHRDRQTQKVRQTDRHTYIHTYIHIYIYIYIYIHTYMHACMHA